MGLYHYDSGQYLFDRFLNAIWFVAKWIVKAVAYIPLWFTGYILTSTILHKEDSAFVWIGLIVLFALIHYQLLFFIKGMIIGFLNEGNLCWIPLFIICIAFTSLLPVWLAFDRIQIVAYEISGQSGDILTWIIISAFAIFLYSRYHFLTNIAPAAAFPVYQLGIDAALALLRVSPYLDAEKSRQMI